MDIKTILLIFCIIHCTLCAYEDQQYKQEPQVQYKPQQPLYREAVTKPPPPRILSHKQAQSHDGGFKFAYTAENGMSHSEIIAPDGTRNGGYSYVDPHGKTISVKYTAGKDGFRILEGDHIPKDKPTQQAAQQTQSNYQQDQNQNSAAYQQGFQKPSFYQSPQLYQKVALYQNPSPQVYQKPSPQAYQKPIQHYDKAQSFYIAQKSAPYNPPPPPRNYPPPQARNYHHQAPAQVQESSNSVEQIKEPDYHDEPGKPYSFGVGYAFQFGS